jgi:cobalt transporter subunit CbtB
MRPEAPTSGAPTAAHSGAPSVSPAVSAIRQALAWLTPVLMGMALLGVIGFAPYPAVHDAFHDVRHTAGFPCH